MNNAIKLKLINTFVKKEVDLENPQVIAAIIQATCKMARCIDLNEENILTSLAQVFELDKNTQVQDLITLYDLPIKSLIGYSIDLDDYGASKAEYEANKDNYISLYNILLNSLTKKDSIKR